MANFVYLIGDSETRECAVVDPAWDVKGILDLVDREDMQLVGALVTHYHPDHTGGSMLGYAIEGLAELMTLRPVKVHVNKVEKDGVKRVSGLSDTDFEEHEGGDKITIGSTAVRFLHTPGHTAGSQCFLLDSAVVSGDTLFIGGCGRVDLPGGNAVQLYDSLTNVLARLPDSTLLLPGHNYGSKTASTIGDEKVENFYLRIKSMDDWLRLMGQS
jgi:glyoxylase-like metal-dependent hydrolase (beta-lactamase superfamily II)